MRSIKDFSITLKMFLIFMLFAILLLSSLGLITYQNARTSLRAAAISELLSTSIEKEAALNEWVTDIEVTIQNIAAQPHLQESISVYMAALPGSPRSLQVYTDVRSDLQNWTANSSRFISLQVIAASNGQVLVSTDPNDEGKFRENTPYFLEGLNAPYVENPFYDLSLAKNIMAVSAPVTGPDGRLLAVLAGTIDLGEMNQIIQRRTGLHRLDDAYLINTSNLFVTQPRLQPNSAILQRGIHTPAVKACLERTSGVIEAPDYRNEPAIVSYRWLADRQMCLITKIDQSEAYASSRELSITMLIIAVGTLLASALLAIFLTQTVTRPILLLNQGVGQVSQGNLGFRIPVDTRDEIGQLSQSFNLMAASIQEKDTKLSSWAAELEERVQERTLALKDAIEELENSKASLEISNIELERFAYVASHDLQEPLRMVTSYLQLLDRRTRGKLDSEALEFIQYAVEGSNRMKMLINDLLTYSRVNTRGQELTRTDSETALEQSLQVLQLAIDEASARVSHDPLPVVMADEIQLEQLFQNLVGNAIKFKGDRPSHIHIGVERKEGQRGPEWLFSVKDNGIGIDPQYFERIFILFQRLHGREAYPGTGIGLAVCQRIVERHGGRIWVESTPGQGSTFFFTLPVVAEQP
jgi:signal transduction histidine kinase